MYGGLSWAVHIKKLGLCLVAAMLAAALGGCSAPNEESNASEFATPSEISAVTEQAQATKDEPAQDSSASAGSDTASGEGISWYDNLEAGYAVIPSGQLIAASQLKEWIDGASEVQVIDLRSNRVFASGHIPSAKNVPTGSQFDIRIDEISHEMPVVLVSDDESHLGTAWQTMANLGYGTESVFVLDGGVRGWSDAGYPLQEEELLKC